MCFEDMLIFRNILFPKIIYWKKDYNQSCMEFTQIQQISSFFKPVCKYNNNQRRTSFVQLSSAYNQNLNDEPLFQEAMTNISQLTSAKLEKTQESQKNINVFFTEKSIHFNKSQNNNFQYQNQVESTKKYDRSKSIMFKSSWNSRCQSDECKREANFVRVFYFDSPILKLVPYNNISTIRQLIQRALEMYQVQNNSIRRGNEFEQKYEMRLPISENSFSPDMTIEPIHNDRNLSENMFQTLILVQKLKQKSLETKPTKQYSFDESSLSLSNSIQSQNLTGEPIKFILMDETYFELFRIDLDKHETLIKLFKLIQLYNLNNSKNFVVKDDIESQFDLKPDHEVKLIKKNRLYLLTKKYLDDAEDQAPGPIKLKSLIQQQLNYLPPIGMNEASRYEQFDVTKINSFGLAIERILGIDQTKIYNYQKQLRQQKREASIMNKLLGFNHQTGTKKPFRLIKEILFIKKFLGGIQLVYPEKTTTFLIKNQITLERIYRKLFFLHELNNKKALNKLNEVSKPTKKNPFQSFD